MQRVLEPELMDDEQQALAYAQADFSLSNQLFVDRFLLTGSDIRHAIDLGCGPADVLLRLARANPHLHITGVDGSAPMITLAASAVQAADMEQQIALLQSYIPGVPVEPHSFDAVLSKSFLHHLAQPLVLWEEVRRLGKAGATVCVMDLVRPASIEDARALVERLMPQEHALLKRDFYQSLCAACTVAEVEDQLCDAGLMLRVEYLLDRYMLITGRLEG